MGQLQGCARTSGFSLASCQAELEPAARPRHRRRLPPLRLSGAGQRRGFTHPSVRGAASVFERRRSRAQSFWGAQSVLSWLLGRSPHRAPMPVPGWERYCAPVRVLGVWGRCSETPREPEDAPSRPGDALCGWAASSALAFLKARGTSLKRGRGRRVGNGGGF